MSDAALVGNLIFEHAERKPLTDDVRNRLAARAAVLNLEHIVPWFGSLARDPVHPSTYYLAVDADSGAPLLLHIALAAAPTSSVFRRPLLIGRARRPNGTEMVINAIPFGPADREAADLYAARIDAAVLPRPAGARTAILAAPSPGAFEAFRAIARRTGRNVAAFAAPSLDAAGETFAAALRCAVRAGWRDGYRVSLPIAPSDDNEPIRRHAGFSGFRFDGATLASPAGPAEERFRSVLESAARAHETIRQARSAMKTGRSFDFELSLEGVGPEVTAAELSFCLDWLKTRGCAVQAVAPGGFTAGNLAARAPELAEAARSFGCALSLAANPEYGPDHLDLLARATAGRVHYRLAPDTAGEPEQISLAAAHLMV